MSEAPAAVVEAPAPYRATVFHRSQPLRVVLSAGEYAAAIADGWADTPAAFYEPALVMTPVSSDAPAIAPSDAVELPAPPRRRGRRPASESA